jgi:hypothetical protein
MKNYFATLLCFIFYCQIDAQIIKNNNQCIGFGKFKLGESKSKYSLTLINGGKYNYKNHEYGVYGYTPPVDEPFEILKTRFHTTLMTFDDSDKLVCLHFIKFYKKTETNRFKKKAKDYYRQLINYFTVELASKGVSRMNKSPYNDSDFTMEQVWDDKITSLIIRKSIYSLHAGIDVIISIPGGY